MREALINDLSRQLSEMLSELVANKQLSEQDRRILSLRLGLEDGNFYTLCEVADMLHKSSEVIRIHQYLLLKRNTKNLRFLKLLRDYAHAVKLPRGLTYYLRQYSEDEHCF